MPTEKQVNALEHDLNVWVNDGTAQAGERRDEVVKEIIEAYNNSSDSLDISGSNLTSLPKSIGELTTLCVLNLSGNQLTSLPESIGNLTSLQKLDVANNQLTSLPESIGNLVNLKELRLLCNQLSFLPQSIFSTVRQDYLEILLENNRTTEEEVKRLNNAAEASHIYLAASIYNPPLPSSTDKLSSYDPIKSDIKSDDASTTATFMVGNQRIATGPTSGGMSGSSSAPPTSAQGIATEPTRGGANGSSVTPPTSVRKRSAGETSRLDEESGRGVKRPRCE